MKQSGSESKGPDKLEWCGFLYANWHNETGTTLADNRPFTTMLEFNDENLQASCYGLSTRKDGNHHRTSHIAILKTKFERT